MGRIDDAAFLSGAIITTTLVLLPGQPSPSGRGQDEGSVTETRPTQSMHKLFHVSKWFVHQAHNPRFVSSILCLITFCTLWKFAWLL